MKVLAPGSEAMMPGDPTRLAHGGICTVDTVALKQNGVSYIVSIPGVDAFAEYDADFSASYQLAPTANSKFLDLEIR